MIVLVTLAAVYAALVLAGCLGYRALLYPAPRDGGPAREPGAELLSLRAADGVEVQALLWPAPPGAPTVVHFHGNGETLRTVAEIGPALRRRGVGVLLVEYRGYGNAAGAPTEEGLYLDAAAALDALAARGAPAERVALWGTSLGSGVAAEMAARGRCGALVLVTPYTSIPAVAGRITPWLPVSLIVGDRFDTLAKAGRIQPSTLIIHGDQDELIPYAMGRELAGAIAGARLVTVPGGHHNDLFARDGERLLDAIAAHARGEQR